MRILERLQDHIPETDDVRRVEVLAPDTSCVSTVLVRVPPRHEFPMHVHPESEDCFFALRGAGEAFSSDQHLDLSAVAGVWVPAGVAHGLSADAQGMLEIGFQAPRGRAVEVDSRASGCDSGGIVAKSIPAAPESGRTFPEWRMVLENRPAWRYLDPRYCFLKTSQQLHAVADGFELIVIVARGAIELSETAEGFGAIALIQLRPGESAVLRSLEANTLLLGVRAYTSDFA